MVLSGGYHYRFPVPGHRRRPVPDLPPDLLVPEPFEEPVGSALLGPVGHEGGEAGARGDVRVLVEGHVDALPPALLHEPQGVLRLAPVRLPGGLEVGYLDRDARPPADLDGLLHGLEEGLPLPPDVAEVDAVEVLEDLRELDDLVGLCECARRVDEPGGHPPRPVLQRLGDEPLHLLQLRTGRLPVLVPHHVLPDGALANHRDDVEGGAGGVYEAHVLRHGLPVELEVLAEARPHVFLPVGPHLGVHGGGRAPAVPDDLGGHPLADLALYPRVDQDGVVRVAVDVDETGGHDAPRCVDPPPRLGSLQPSDGLYPVRDDADIGIDPRVA